MLTATPSNSRVECLADGVDALRGMCIDDKSAAERCPASRVARQCIAARLNIAASSCGDGTSCLKAGSPYSDFYSIIETTCCNGETPAAAGDLTGCADKLAWFNADKDLEAPDAMCDGAPTGYTSGLDVNTDPTARACLEYAQEGSSAAIDDGSCAAGFCAKRFNLAAPAEQGVCFARTAAYWSANADEAQFWAKAKPITLWCEGPPCACRHPKRVCVLAVPHPFLAVLCALMLPGQHASGSGAFRVGGILGPLAAPHVPCSRAAGASKC